jgi:hypothetical protein
MKAALRNVRLGVPVGEEADAEPGQSGHNGESDPQPAPLRRPHLFERSFGPGLRRVAREARVEARV